MRSSSFFSEIRSLFPKVRREEGAIIAEREEFAREMREAFRGNTRLLKTIGEGMNRNVRPHERVSLTD